MHTKIVQLHPPINHQILPFPLPYLKQSPRPIRCLTPLTPFLIFSYIRRNPLHYLDHKKCGPESGQTTQVCYFTQILVLVHTEEQILLSGLQTVLSRSWKACPDMPSRFFQNMSLSLDLNMDQIWTKSGPNLDQIWTEVQSPNLSGQILAVIHYLFEDIQF
jgi:hypothetical protein